MKWTSPSRITISSDLPYDHHLECIIPIKPKTAPRPRNNFTIPQAYHEYKEEIIRHVSFSADSYINRSTEIHWYAIFMTFHFLLPKRPLSIWVPQNEGIPSMKISGDVDNYCKGLLDALQGKNGKGLLLDDREITTTYIEKVRTLDTPRITFTAYGIDRNNSPFGI